MTQTCRLITDVCRRVAEVPSGLQTVEPQSSNNWLPRASAARRHEKPKKVEFSEEPQNQKRTKNRKI